MSSEGAPSRPNILLIMTDQQRYDQLGFASRSHFETPNLDRLAENGVVFENAYSSSTVCVPARCSLITGLYPHRCPKQEGDNLGLQEGFWTVAHALRNAGYQTAQVGKGHYTPIHARHGFEKMRMVEHIDLYDAECVDDYMRWLVWEGKCDWKATVSHRMFGGVQDHWDEEQKAGLREFGRNRSAVKFAYPKYYHPTEWVKRESIDFLAQRDPDRPYFLMVSFPHPHTPYVVPEPYDTLYNEEETEFPAPGREADDGLPQSFKGQLAGPKCYGFDHIANMGDQVGRRCLTYMRALIKHIDDAIGEILENVDLENTAVFFTADHGDFYGHRGLIGKCISFPLDDLARVPLICAGVGFPKGKRIADVAQSFDFTPTALELAGIARPPVAGVDRYARGLDSQSLVGYFEDGADHGDRVVYTSSTMRISPMVRRRNIKYFRHQGSGEELLFDVAEDPGETVNRIDDPAYAEDARDLRAALDEILKLGVPDFPRMDRETASLDFRVD